MHNKCEKCWDPIDPDTGRCSCNSMRGNVVVNLDAKRVEKLLEEILAELRKKPNAVEGA